MRPKDLKTKIFLDGGNPQETKDTLEAIGFLDGQTTNPTLISKHPDVIRRLEEGRYFSEDEIFENYKSIVSQISQLIPDGSISIEVNANHSTGIEEILTQARRMFSWIPNAHIKLPTITQGLDAAERATKEGIRVNMTLCFTQEQAAAVHAATMGAPKGSVFVSPFIGRLDDKGYDGMGLIENIMEMYRKGDSHVELLVASVRNMEHFMRSLQLQADIVTAPYKILKQWADDGTPMPGSNFKYDSNKFQPIPYKELNMRKPWKEIGFQDELIDKGLKTFSGDWIKLTGKEVR